MTSTPSLYADPVTVITWAVNSWSPLHFYLDRLGLPQATRSSIRGKITFEGPAAADCARLENASNTAANRLLRRFSIKDDLRQVPLDFHMRLSTEITTPTLDMYGPILWVTGNPVTYMSPKDCRRHLQYENASDRNRCVVFLAVNPRR